MIRRLVNDMTMLKRYFLLIFFHVTASNTIAQQKGIYPDGIWKDKAGNHIQVHGAGIIKIKNTYYWYAEERSKGLDTNFRYVSCYSSKVTKSLIGSSSATAPSSRTNRS